MPQAGPYARCESLKEGVSIARDVKELFYAEVVHLSLCRTGDEAAYILLSALLSGY